MEIMNRIIELKLHSDIKGPEFKEEMSLFFTEVHENIKANITLFNLESNCYSLMLTEKSIVIKIADSTDLAVLETLFKVLDKYSESYDVIFFTKTVTNVSNFNQLAKVIPNNSEIEMLGVKHKIHGKEFYITLSSENPIRMKVKLTKARTIFEEVKELFEIDIPALQDFIHHLIGEMN